MENIYSVELSARTILEICTSTTKLGKYLCVNQIFLKVSVVLHYQKWCRDTFLKILKTLKNSTSSKYLRVTVFVNVILILVF